MVERTRSQQYEIKNNPDALDEIKELGQVSRDQDVTLLCHCIGMDKHCHRFIIQELVERENRQMVLYFIECIEVCKYYKSQSLYIKIISEIFVCQIEGQTKQNLTTVWVQIVPICFVLIQPAQFFKNIKEGNMQKISIP